MTIEILFEPLAKPKKSIDSKKYSGCGYYHKTGKLLG